MKYNLFDKTQAMLAPSQRDKLWQQRNRLYRIAYSWCGDAMLADDLTQEALSRALKKYEQLKEASKLNPWLFRILHNCWMEYLRRKRPDTDLDSVELLDHISPEMNVNQHQIIDSLHLAISKLPVGQRQVLTLVDLEQCGYADVAEILNIPAGTVMSRLSRARNTLRKSLLHLKESLPHLDEGPRLWRVK